MLYQSAFSVLVSERIASEQVNLSKFNQLDFESAALLSLSEEDLSPERKTVRVKERTPTPKVTMVEIEDESRGQSHGICPSLLSMYWKRSWRKLLN